MFTDNRTGTIMALYVDDALITSPNRADIQRVKDTLNARFRMTDLGPYAYYLGITITRDRVKRTIRLGQARYIERVLRDNSIQEAKLVSTPIETLAKYEPVEEGYQATQKDKTRY